MARYDRRGLRALVDCEVLPMLSSLSDLSMRITTPSDSKAPKRETLRAPRTCKAFIDNIGRPWGRLQESHYLQ